MDTTDTEDEDLPQISLQEMLDDLHIADDPMGMRTKLHVPTEDLLTS